MQEEHRAWLLANYPNQPAEVPAAGLVEEAGELMHAVLKRFQLARWGDDPRYSREGLQRELVDAIGDVAVYACSYCNCVGWDFGDVMEQSLGGWSKRSSDPLTMACDLVASAAAFAARAGKAHQTTLSAVLLDIRAFAECEGLNFHHCVWTTWETVKARKRCAKPRIVCLCGSTRFKSLFAHVNKEETRAGRIVLSVGDLDQSEAARDVNVPCDPELKQRLDELHLRKIDLADEVLILNGMACRECGKPADTGTDGLSLCCGVQAVPYIGQSTARELAYAREHSKKVRFYHNF